MIKNSVFIKWTAIVFTLVLCIYLIAQEDLSEFLKSTKLIDSDHPSIIKKAKELTEECKTQEEKAKFLFEYVRDSYDRSIYESYKASDVLEGRGNLCYQRATLLTALCRSSGIPACLSLQKVTMIRGKEKGVFAHAVTGIYMNGEWHLYETTGNEEKWIALTGQKERGNEMPVEFYPDRDCLFVDNDRVKTKNIHVRFTGWTEEMLEAIKKIDGCKYIKNFEQFNLK